MFGYVAVEVEGFFVERFINICKQKKILLWNIKRTNSTIVNANIKKSEYRKIKEIVKKTKCRIKIKQKKGIPFLINRYRKRKIFAIAFLVIAILIFGMTRYIWNIEINGIDENMQISLLEDLKENGIEKGKKKSNINIEQAINSIRLKRNDIAWIGINIRGTNAIIDIIKSEDKPEIVDENQFCNIIAKKDGIITKINAQKGTARIIPGEIVKKGDLLVEGVMEGKYTEQRMVHAQAEVFAKVWYTKEKTEPLVKTRYELTGKEKNKYQININNFKINLNKGVSKFKNYDTITTNKKLKLFSNLFIPVEVVKISYKETIETQKEYTAEELINKMKNELEEELTKDKGIDKEKILERKYNTYQDKNNVYLKIILIVEENIAESTEIVF